MRTRGILLLVLAFALAGSAVFLARNWLATQLAQQAPASTEQATPAPRIGTIVVAAVPLRFGTTIGAEHVKEVPWPADSMPPGAFAEADALLQGEPRTVLEPMQPNEPVLGSKITGPGQRASLSALIEDGMRAITIRVNDVLGVAGFVLPGDRVDILLTREVGSKPITDVLLQNVRVLGIDQLADETHDDPMVVKAVTLEVTTKQAQKLTLASRVGTLGLALRGVAYVATEPVQRIGVGDLSVGEAIKPEGEEVAKAEEKKTKVVRVVRRRSDPYAKVGITRGLVRKEYRVTPGRTVLPYRPVAPLPQLAAPGVPTVAQEQRSAPQAGPATPPATAAAEDTASAAEETASAEQGPATAPPTPLLPSYLLSTDGLSL